METRRSTQECVRHGGNCAVILAWRLRSDWHDLAWGHRYQSVQDGLYKWQQVFKLICPGTDKNDGELPPSEILLVTYTFKALKQTLKSKTFVGTSANAVRTQVWTALIAMLVLKYLQLKSKFSWSLSTLAALLRQQLFFYRDLWVWLDDPFQAPPALVGVHDDAQQLEITW